MITDEQQHIITFYINRRRALISELVSIEDVLMQYKAISRRAVISRRKLKRGEVDIVNQQSYNVK